MPIQWIWEGTQAPTYFFFNAAQVISASETEIPWIGCPKSQLVPWKREVNCSASLAAELVQKGSLLWPQVNGPGTLEKGPLTFCNSTEDVNLGAVGDRHFFFLFFAKQTRKQEGILPQKRGTKAKLSRKSSGGERGLSVYPKNVRSASYQFPRPSCILGSHETRGCPFPNL